MPCAIGEYALSANFDFLRPLQGPDMPCAIGEYALSANFDFLRPLQGPDMPCAIGEYPCQLPPTIPISYPVAGLPRHHFRRTRRPIKLG